LAAVFFFVLFFLLFNLPKATNFRQEIAKEQLRQAQDYQKKFEYVVQKQEHGVFFYNSYLEEEAKGFPGLYEKQPFEEEATGADDIYTKNRGNSMVSAEEKDSGQPIENKKQGTYQDFSNNILQFIENIKPWFPAGMGGMLLAVFIALLVKTKGYSAYLKGLRRSLFRVAHRWLNGNSIEKILISVYVDQNGKKVYLTDAFLKVIRNRASGVYALLGNAGDGKTMGVLAIIATILKSMDAKEKPAKTKQRFLGTRHKATVIPVLFNYGEMSNLSNDIEIHSYILNKMMEVMPSSILWKIKYKWSHVIDWVIEKDLCDGRFVFFLDGYDEVDRAVRQNVTRVWKNISMKYSNCIFLVCSRYNAFQKDSFWTIEEERIFNLEPLNMDLVWKFLSNWKFQTPKNRLDLYWKIKNNTQLRQISTCPLLLTLICYLYSKSKLIVPNSISIFYAAALKCILEDWEKEKRNFGRNQPDLEITLPAIANVAYCLFSIGTIDISKQERLKELNDSVSSMGYAGPQVLDELVQSGLMVETQQKRYRFYHRSFQDFLTAYYVYSVKKENVVHELCDSPEILLFFFSLQKILPRPAPLG